MAAGAAGRRMSADPYRPRSPADVPALIDAHPLCWIVARDFQAAVLPLVAEPDEAGALRSLLGHCALRNPLVESLRRDPSALILVQGPQAYVSPRLVSNLRWGPTWNYAVARIEADVEFLPQETDAAIRRLAAHLEPDGEWAVERMEERYEQLLRRIVAFRATVRSVDARFKLGQDEAETTFHEIVGRHPDQALASLMREQQAIP